MPRVYYLQFAAAVSALIALAPGEVRAGGQCYGGAAASNVSATYRQAPWPIYIQPHAYYTIPQTYHAPGHAYYVVPQAYPAVRQPYYVPQYGTNAENAELAKLRQVLPLVLKLAELRSQIRSQMRQTQSATQEYGSQSNLGRPPCPPRSKDVCPTPTPPEAESRAPARCRPAFDGLVMGACPGARYNTGRVYPLTRILTQHKRDS
jgi:hypothetical protein